MKAFFEVVNRGTSDFCFQCYSFTKSHACEYFAPIHWHDEIEILYIYKGAVKVFIDGEYTVLTDRDICFLNPNRLHGVTVAADGTAYDAFVFSPEVLTFSGNNFFNFEIISPIVNRTLRLPKKISATHEKYPEIARHIETLASYCKMSNKMRALALGELVGVFAALYCHGFLATENCENENRNLGTVKQCTEYLKAHYSEKITLKQLADICYMSPNYFCTYYKKFTGVTPFAQLNAIRVDAAKSLLKNTALPISDIAVRCGFDSTSYFIRTFKKHTELSPREYKNGL